MQRGANSRQRGARSPSGLVDRNAAEIAGTKRRSPRSVPRRSWILGAAAAVLIAGATGWRLSAQHSARAARRAAVSSPEAALQLAAEQRPRDPEPWRKLGQLYLTSRQPF